jgi:hypothetical protein
MYVPIKVKKQAPARSKKSLDPFFPTQIKKPIVTSTPSRETFSAYLIYFSFLVESIMAPFSVKAKWTILTAISTDYLVQPLK